MKTSVFLLLILGLGFAAAIIIDVAGANLDLLWDFLAPLDVLCLVLLLIALAVECPAKQKPLKTKKTGRKHENLSAEKQKKYLFRRTQL